MTRVLRLSQQAIDPLGAITSMGITWIGAGLAGVIPIVTAIAHADEMVNPAASVVGVVFAIMASVAAAAGVAPSRAPFTSERLALVTTLALVAAIAEYVSTAGRNRFVYDDYGPAIIGILLLSLAPFCTWVSLAAAGVFSSGVLSVLVLGVARSTATSAPLPAYLIVNAAGVLAFTAAAVAYSVTVVGGILAWQREANREALRRDRERDAGVDARSPMSRVSMLRREVLPFLAQVMTSDRISVQDADRARELAEELRRALRAGIDSTWLDDLAASLVAPGGASVQVIDPGADARHFIDDQRTAVTALLSWLAGGDRASSITVRTERDTGDAGGRLVVEAERGRESISRREFERFAAVARSVGLGTKTDFADDRVRVELAYAAE
ncbi:hypothetical protein GE115_11175 [Agromyces sp. CFH 90414]|uniref:Uncharacterized protein n=1 Tax=Agromyces agglutinans TaxID=2662258 RepID=A0A6I2F6Q5_9MICO|nr:hypothetical protein [Agromyces agglutinans]MRG60422.1 hypothetical protein [Agromyces agglutinans]